VASGGDEAVNGTTRQGTFDQEPGTRQSPGFVGELVRRLASLDWLLLGYLLTLLFEVAFGSGPRRAPAVIYLSVDLAGFVGILWLIRGQILKGEVLPGILYRFAVMGALLSTFFELQWILPAASGPAVDAQLHALDLRLFGVEPAQAFDRFVRPATTEWFSFFYYGYFFLLAAHVFPAMLFGRTERLLTRFGFGTIWLYCVGHVVYTLVPAYGPYAYLSF
jgi:hypothetical protein